MNWHRKEYFKIFIKKVVQIQETLDFEKFVYIYDL